MQPTDWPPFCSRTAKWPSACANPARKSAS